MLGKIYRKIRPAKRLYKYGTVGLSLYDDRTKLERLFDCIDSLISKVSLLRRSPPCRTQIWHSYFDHSLGIMIDRPGQIQELEKKHNLTYTTFSEMENTAARVKKERKEELRNKIKESARDKLRQIKNGRSFYREALEKARQNKS